MPNIRVMFVGQGPSGLPEDRVVNTFHFTGTGTAEEVASLARTKVAQFYTNPFGVTNTISWWLSAWVSRLAELRSYDLADAKPRVPTIEPLQLTAGPTDGLPEEVAVCLSYHGLPPITPRRRGRVYIGPLRNAACDQATTTSPARPTQNFIDDLAFRASVLGTASLECQWVIRSSIPVENFVPIAAGYVDNAFDTQRRRGPEETARELWTAIAA